MQQRNFQGRGALLEFIYSTYERKAPHGNILEFFLRDTLKA